MNCMVKYGCPSDSPTWKTGTMCGCASRDAAIASTRNRSMSCAVDAGPRKSRLSATIRLPRDLPRPRDDPHAAPSQLLE